MPLYYNPSGRGTYGIALCDRCKRKFSVEELIPDSNSPGLFVCRADWDTLDPYRLPPRETEDITLPFVRPDEPLTVPE